MKSDYIRKVASDLFSLSLSGLEDPPAAGQSQPRRGQDRDVPIANGE